jgi:hypothetical protein
MPWTYEYNSTLQIVDVIHTGKVTAHELRESVSEFIRLEEEKGLNRFFIDATEMELASSLIDIYDMPTKQFIEQKADRMGRVAIIPPSNPKTKEDVRFFETVCKNRGWMVNIFTNRETAVKWLAKNLFAGKPNGDDNK